MFRFSLSLEMSHLAFESFGALNGNVKHNACLMSILNHLTCNNIIKMFFFKVLHICSYFSDLSGCSRCFEQAEEDDLFF